MVSYAAPLAEAAAGPWLVEARHTAGIRADMPLAEATALAGFAQADAVHLELHDPLADRRALEVLADACQRFSPSVGLEEGDRPESLLLDTSGVGPVFGSEARLVAGVLDELTARGLVGRVAMADTVGGAWAVAHFAELAMPSGEGEPAADCPLTLPSPRRGEGEDKERAVVLRAIAVPVIVDSGAMSLALAPLSIAALRLPVAICERLAELGLVRIEQVLALPRSALLSRFGPELLVRLDQARGGAAEAITTREVPSEWQFAWPFEHPASRPEIIDAALEQLIARVCQALGAEQRGALRLGCRLEMETRTTGRPAAEECVVGFYRPTADPRHMGELVRLKLESLRVAHPVANLRLAVLASDRLEYRQQEIFAAAEQATSRALAALIDRLSNRLGADRVTRPWLLAGAQPEFACQYQPLASLPARRGIKQRGSKQDPSKRGKRVPSDSNNSAPRVPGDRPLVLHPRPLKLPVMSVAPEGPPVRFRHLGAEHRVARFWGPERIETGWWRFRGVRRDYYQVETGDGQRFWLFRELTSGAWFLHGEFV